jgi:hypothetical protein
LTHIQPFTETGNKMQPLSKTITTLSRRVLIRESLILTRAVRRRRGISEHRTVPCDPMRDFVAVTLLANSPQRFCGASIDAGQFGQGIDRFGQSAAGRA